MRIRQKTMCAYWHLIVLENPATEKELKQFNNGFSIVGKYENHLKFVAWQEIVTKAEDCGFDKEHIKQFQEKYLVYSE